MEIEKMLPLVKIPELSRSNVMIPDPALVCDKLKRMSEGGKEALQVLSDFDKTLTQSTVYDRPAMGTFEIFSYMEEVPITFKSEVLKVLPDYKRSLCDGNMNLEERSQLVEHALRSFEKLLPLIPFSDSTPIKKEAAKGKFKLRERIEIGFELLNENSVPITVLSAGFGNMIEALLELQGILFSNIRIIANYFSFKDGRIEKLDDELVHVFNKSFHYLKSDLYHKRQNIILLGDSLSDINMADGVPETCNKLNIAFFSPNEWDGDVENFKKIYDIVITEDESMDVVNAIFRYILKTS